jgi:hypothetical protein
MKWRLKWRKRKTAATKRLEAEVTKVNLFFGMTSSFPSYSLTSLGPKKPGQVNTPPKFHKLVRHAV